MKRGDVITRRTFCALTAGTVGSFARPSLAKEASFNVAEFDRKRVLAAADRYLSDAPVTVTAATSPRSAVGKHDFFSEGDYWWPDPKDPSGPYIRRDGMSNPDNFGAHRDALLRFSVEMPALMAACVLTHDARYSRKAIAHLRAWFLDPETRMNANLQYAQAIHGITPGRGTGVIDTLHLVEVARAVEKLTAAHDFTDADRAGVKGWFGDYLNWMTTSKNGIEERDAKNNHGTCWCCQAASFAHLTANDNVMRFIRDR